ncbi:unnamed protein product [Penicillium nalgiovense]|nr:unnamed protein product [Penicillium nalgiovense]
MDEQIQLPGNKKRASWRLTCRTRLAQHIFERLELEVDPSEVRLKTEDECLYAWEIDDPSLEPLFQKHLSKHSVRAYMLLHREVGQKFRAVLAKREKQTDVEMVARIQVENLSLEEKLKAAEAKVSRFEEVVRQAEAEIKGRNSTIQEAQMTIQLHQQDILNWMAVAEWYQTKCFQCSNVLGQMMAFLQDTTSELK